MIKVHGGVCPEVYRKVNGLACDMAGDFPR